MMLILTLINVPSAVDATDELKILSPLLIREMLMFIFSPSADFQATIIYFFRKFYISP